MPWTGKIYVGKSSGKIVYVGQTQTTLDKRIKRHIEQYPHRQKWSWKIIERFSEQSVFELWRKLDAAEKQYIKKLNTRHPNGENRDGGGVSAGFRLKFLERHFPDL